MTTREAFLQRVRQAVVEGNRLTAAPPMPERGRTGYQGAGADPVPRFCQELRNAGGVAHEAKSSEHARAIVRELVSTKSARKLLLSRGGIVERLELPRLLRDMGSEVLIADALPASTKDAFFQADLGISNVAYLVAETGTVVVATSAITPPSPLGKGVEGEGRRVGADPRSISLLPPVHIAVAQRNQILPDLFDLFDLFSPIGAKPQFPPSCLTLITGPSKTGDIELKLVTGVHGPGEVHVVICD
ncbi:MAG: lactate utilization protein [Gemmataceae bacterium]|nr:lactate utilization protein [Gemmataceae bacterium]